MLTVFQVFVIPFQFIRERYLVSFEQRSPFVKKATPFQDFVIRCVRYAFANMPAFLGRVFFSKPVSLPFLRFRMLRHGVVTSPIRWTEIKRVSRSSSSDLHRSRNPREYLPFINASNAWNLNPSLLTPPRPSNMTLHTSTTSHQIFPKSSAKLTPRSPTSAAS